MKSFGIAAVIVALAASATAKNCRGGLAYCASTLLSKGRIAPNHCPKSKTDLKLIGNYAPQINQALSLAHQTKPEDQHKALFFCEGGSNGNIVFTTSCASGCMDGGAGKDDYCSA